MAISRKNRKSLRTRTRPTRTHVRGKITTSSLTREMVEERARELAFIEGRNPHQVTTSDRRAAKRELQGRVRPPRRATDDPALTKPEWGTPPPTPGKRARKISPADGQLSENLVEEGVSDAEHDRMVAARKSHK